MAAEAAPGSVGSFGGALKGDRGADLALRLTLVALLLSPIGGPGLRLLLLALPAAGLVFPPLLRRASLWGLLGTLAALRVALDWPLADNHAYLLAYWCLAVAFSLGARDVPGALARNARVLVGLVFAFATLWKILSPDYLDGSFLGATLLLDPRFEGATRWFAGISLEDLEAHRAVLRAHVDGLQPAAVAGLELAHRFSWMATGATLWTVAIEALLAVVFLWPGERGPARLRDAALLVFAASTYSVATVEGFGWLLLAMGLAQCPAERRRTRLAYVAAFALILFYREVPWAVWLAEHAPLPT
ncbi:MAG: hypothetical protein JRH10_09220 [Deltaproteobacteria bacterium]|nr:hypothetical protein [Deltaproteobacteria bacterium]MBW2445694.1 hypothetical protein [Deltaproteobacteria bacterium]